jgi:hypothetical protein
MNGLRKATGYKNAGWIKCLTQLGLDSSQCCAMGLIAQQSEALLHTITTNAKTAGMTTMLNCLCFDFSLGVCISRAMPPALLTMPFQDAVQATA